MRNVSLGSPSSFRPTWLLLIGIIASLALFIVGMWSVPFSILGPDQTFIPGDLGDARFNNYVLEHFHCFITGRTANYWSAPFMYPYPNVIAFSDNLLGTAPIYSLFRSLGYGRETSFQCWILSLFALNYWCCFIALRKWSGNTVLAACAAYIFAFGIYNAGQLNNAQVLPRFIAPLAFLFLWDHLRSGSLKHLFLTVLALVYQFYCGMYLGFILAYALFFILVAHLVMVHKPSFLHRFKERRFVLMWCSAALVGLALLAPLMLPYMHSADTTGMRSFSDVIASIPRPTSYFFAHPVAESWRSLSGLGVDEFPLWWCHFHFIGGVPWAAVIAAPFLLLLKRVDRMDLAVVGTAGVALVLSTAFCLNVNDHTLYALVFNIPGFSAMRSIDRFINVQVLFFLFLFVAVLRPLFQKPWAAVALTLALPLLVVQDNRWQTDIVKHYDKHHAQDLVTEMERRITREHIPGNRYDAIVYEPPQCFTKWSEGHLRTITTQLTAMLAAQDLGIPIVNAYSGSYPGNYISFFDHMDHRTLADWCIYNGTSIDRVQEIHGLALPVVQMDTVQFKAVNGKFICTDESKGGLALADRGRADSWETFIRIRVADGRCAFLAHNGNYLCAELEQRKQWSATALDLGDYGLFTLEPQPDGKVALRAFNGLYLALDPESNEIRATRDGTGPDTQLEMIPFTVPR